MYYIAFFIDWKKNLIVPKQWIKDIKKHKEKFYNKSLNSSQKFTCFYTNDPGAFGDDDLPNGNFAPNFNLRLTDNLNDSGSGLFLVQLRAYRATREGALDYIKRHRNVAPGIYNEQRVHENPIPDLSLRQNIDSDAETSVEDIIIPEADNSVRQGESSNGNSSNENVTQNISVADTSVEDIIISEADNNAGHGEPSNGDSANQNVTQNIDDPSNTELNGIPASPSQNDEQLQTEIDEINGGDPNSGISDNQNIDNQMQTEVNGAGNVTEHNGTSPSRNDEQLQTETDEINGGDPNSGISENENGSQKAENPSEMYAADTYGGDDFGKDTSSNQTVSQDTGIVNYGSNQSELNNSGGDDVSNAHSTNQDVAQNIIDSNQNVSDDADDQFNVDSHKSIEQNNLLASNDAHENDTNEATQHVSNDSFSELTYQTDSESNSSQMETKPIIPMYELHRMNSSHILQQLEDFTVEVVEDMEIIMSSKGMPKPLNATDDIHGLIKKEHPDEISGLIPFIKTKTGRAYLIGQRLMEIPNIVISKFINWSKPPFNADTNIDKRFVFAFLLALTEEDKLMVNDIQAEVMDFVQELLKIRCGNDGARIQAFSSYVEELCASQRSNI